MAATALVLGLGAGCSVDEGVSAGGAGETTEAFAPPCEESMVDGLVVDTLADFGGQAEIVARVVEAAKGAERGEVVDVFHAVRSTDPTRRELEPNLQGPEGHDFAAGDRLVVALGPTSEAGERELLAPPAFFVDVDGQLDPELAEARARCTERPLFTDTEGMATTELLAAARAEADTAG